MKIEINENLSSTDRVMRIIAGIGICLSVLLTPLESIWIAVLSFAAMYPLLSGMTAIDPVLAIVENVVPEIEYANKINSSSAT